MTVMNESIDRRVARRTAWLALSTLVWVMTIALAQFGPALLWNHQPVLSWAAVGLTLVTGAAWIVAHGLYLRAGDDLHRKISLDALAIALGVGVVSMLSYASAKTAGLMAFESDIAVFTGVIAVTYIVMMVVGTVRYR